MKSLLSLLLMFPVFCVFSQNRNLDELPPGVRDSLLVKIANEAISKYSTGYLRPGSKPYIEDAGYDLKKIYGIFYSSKERYLNRHHYIVYYLPTAEELSVYEKPYLVKAIILADIGRVSQIRYIDDHNWGVMYGLEVDAPNEKIIKRKFKPAAERLQEIERAQKPVRLDTTPPPELAEKWRRYEERHRRVRDSLLSIYRRDSLRMRRWKDSLRKAALRKNMPN